MDADTGIALVTAVVCAVLAGVAFTGRRWAYAGLLILGVLFFPLRVGFHLHPQPCDYGFTLQDAGISIRKYKHILMFGILFAITCRQVWTWPLRRRFLLGTIVVIAFGVYVEAAEGLTATGGCHARDLVPDLAGAAIAAALVAAAEATRRTRSVKA